MSPIGKQIRLRRISDHTTGRFVIVPMDHGVSSGPIVGLKQMDQTIEKVVNGGATAIVIHKGIVEPGLGKYGGRIGLILHLSASTNISQDPTEKALIASVEEALEIGADAVSIHINVGAETETEMLGDLGEVAHSCRQWQVPLLAMMYPRGPGVKDPFDVEIVKHVARLGAELGADIIKTNYTGSPETFKEVITCCPVPVVIAGGPKVNSDREVLKMVYDAMRVGAAGVSIGRNVFQHSKISRMTKGIAKLVINGADVEEALKAIYG